MKLRELLQQMEDVQKKIGSSRAYICGGTPRDRYLKHLENISDLDITTGDKTVEYLSSEFGDELAKKYNVTRRAHDDGHSSIYIGSFKMDFSSNFNVPGIDGMLIKQGIARPTDMQKEMFSRDFTCNALLLSLDLKNVIDPTHRGFKDLNDRIIRTCLSPEITLTSNKNRVIRAIYLASKLDFDIDPAIVEFVTKNPQSVKISSEKVLAEKLNEAFNRNPDRAAYYINKMGLWQYIPITEVVQPYYMKSSKSQSIKARLSLLFRIVKAGPNYDYGDGAYTAMSEGKKMETITDAPHKSPGAFFCDDNDDHMLPPKEHGTSIYNWRNSIYQGKPGKHKKDSNDIDFPIDDDLKEGPVHFNDEVVQDPRFLGPADPLGDNPFVPTTVNDGDESAYPYSAEIGGDQTYPYPDFEGKMINELDFGRDHSEELPEPDSISDDRLRELLEKYLSPAPNHGLYGLPDGVDMPDEDVGDPNDINPDYGTYGPESLMYEDKWNI